MSWIIIGAVVLIFGAMAGLAFGAYTLLTPNRTSQDRLRDIAPKAGLNNQRDEAVDKIAERISRLANPTDEEERSLLRLEMVRAGYNNRHALEFFSAIRVMLALALPLLVVPTFIGVEKLTTTFGAVIVTAAIGYYVPRLLLTSQIETRQKKLSKPFPDALDLLVSSVEAGLGLDAAFRRVAEEMTTAAPELSKEFQLVNHEISAGVTRIDALRHLADRTGLDEVVALVNMLVQADRFGTSIARSLRVHSSITRQKRMSKAEEEAAKVSPKLTIVMILFLLPCLMVLLLGPAMINIKRIFIDGGE